MPSWNDIESSPLYINQLTKGDTAMMNYIGLDAHSKTCTFAILDREGQLLDKRKVETSEKNLLEVVRSIKGKKKLVFEECGISQWLYLLLVKEVDELIVCNALYLGKNQGPKNDFRDALHLGNELRCNHIVPVFHTDNYLIKIRTLVSMYNDIVRDCTRAKNRYKAVFRSRGIRIDSVRNVYTVDDIISELKNEEDILVAKTLFEQITTLEKQKSQYKAIFANYKKEHQLIKNLSTIPGIDSVRAVPIASILCSAERFHNKHKLWSYAMLTKHTEISDGVIYGSKSKYGRKELKGIFIAAAQSTLNTKSGLRKYYDQLRSKGFNHKKARRAVARRIAAVSLQIMKKGIKYDDKFLEKQKVKCRH